MRHLLSILLVLSPAVLAAVPSVTNVTFEQASATSGRGVAAGASELLITYDLASTEGDCEISLVVSLDGGNAFEVLPESTQGDVGPGIAPGFGKEITWRISDDLPGVAYDSVVIRVMAEDGVCSGCLLWSDPNSWGGTKPVSGDTVTIPEGTTILLDEDTPPLAGLTIEGGLEFARQDLALTSSWIMVHGALRVGSEAEPFTHNATITLNGSDTGESIMGMGTRGIMVKGGELELHGAAPDVVWTRIDAHAPAAGTSITLEQSVDWSAGDEIVIAPTDYYAAGAGASVSQRTAIDSTDGVSLQLAEGLNAFRWGMLQYATASGMSLSPENLVEPPLPDTESESTPRVLDERAAVGNLTRNIVIQSPDDALWNGQGFGVHVMIMGSGASARLDGVEFRRAGQSNRLRRYPFHWHMLSTSGANTLADATGQYIRNSTINSSANRGIVIHGTNGVVVQNNIVFDVRGHGIFTEDAVERRNVIDGNLVLHVRNPPLPGLKQHEVGERGSSGFWISNPDNTLTNNVAADCQTFGFWLAFTTQPWGESASVLHTDGLLLNPSRLQFGVFDNNTAHSNQFDGIMLDFVESSSDGSVTPHQYTSTTDGREPTWDSGTRLRFALTRYKVWKNGRGGIWDRGVWPDNLEVVSADNCGRFFAGSGADGLIERSLVVGTSLNHLMNGTDRAAFADSQGGNETPAAFATYHSSFDIRNNIVVNFPAVENTRSGAFATEDYYLRPVDKGQVRNVGNLLIDSHPGVKLDAIFDYFVLAGALWDPNGNWGIPGEQKYLVHDLPFFTHGQTPAAATGGAIARGVIVEGPFYGFNHFEINRANDPEQDLMQLTVTREDSDRNVVDTWNVDQAGDASWLLAHFRHFAAHPDGFYVIDFPTIDPVTDVAMKVENMLTEDDTVVIAVEFSGARAISQVYTSSHLGLWMSDGHAQWPTSYANKHVYEAVADRDAVIASTGRTYWHDTADNLVWIKVQGGIQMVWNDADFNDTDDERLYREFGLRIY